MANGKPSFQITIVPGSSLPTQPYWPALHALINESYDVKDLDVFPPKWYRLDIDPAKGAKGLADELGDEGHFAIVFNEDHHPVACGGVLPFRGENWITDAFTKSDAELANNRPDSVLASDWETCCWCVHPSARGQRLVSRILDECRAFLKTRGGKRLYCNYVIAETGTFWPKLGFEVVPGGGGMLPKGFKTDPELEGLRADVYFGMGVLTL